MPKDIIELVSKRLNIFKLRSKIFITSSNKKLQITAIWGKEIEIGVGKIAMINDLTIIRDSDCPTYGPRALIICEKKIIEEFEKSYTNSNNSINSLTLKESEFWSGNVWIGKNHSESFIPQTLNLDLNGSISFSKGCYPGQEVVARTHYLGKVKKRVLLSQVEYNNENKMNIIIGEKVYLENYSDNSLSEIGEVVDFTSTTSDKTTGHLKFLLLFQCKVNELPSDKTTYKFRLGSTAGVKLDLLDLPYTVLESNEISK